MAIPNQKLREILFLLLFAESQGFTDEESTIQLVMEQLKVAKSQVVQSLKKARLIRNKEQELDQLLQKIVISYDFDRIQSVEKTALRWGAYELTYGKKLPPQVVIAEALRLTKKFGTPAATAFVNALLDALFKLQEGNAIDEEKIQHSIEELNRENTPGPDSE